MRFDQKMGFNQKTVLSRPQTMINDFHTNDRISPDPTKTISLDIWPSVLPKGSCESTILPLFSHPENIGKIVLSQLPSGGAEVQKPKKIVFVV